MLHTSTEVEQAKCRKVGDPFEDDTEQGAITFRGQFDKVMDLIQSGQEQGATLLTGGTFSLSRVPNSSAPTAWKDGSQVATFQCSTIP